MDGSLKEMTGTLGFSGGARQRARFSPRSLLADGRAALKLRSLQPGRPGRKRAAPAGPETPAGTVESGPAAAAHLDAAAGTPADASQTAKRQLQHAMTDDAERCPRCQQPLRQGAAFCTFCGTPLSNRSARNVRNVRELTGSTPRNAGPSRGPRTRGRTFDAEQLDLVPAAAGKRLGAAVLDWLPPVTVLAILLAVGFAGITRRQSGGFIVYDTSSWCCSAASAPASL